MSFVCLTLGRCEGNLLQDPGQQLLFREDTQERHAWPKHHAPVHSDPHPTSRHQDLQ